MASHWGGGAAAAAFQTERPAWDGDMGSVFRADSSADVDNFVSCRVASPESKVFTGAAALRRRGESHSGRQV